MKRDLIRIALLFAMGAALLAYGLGCHKPPQPHGSGVVVTNGRTSCYVIQGTPYVDAGMTCPSGVDLHDHVKGFAATAG